MKIVRYIISHKEFPGKEYVVTFSQSVSRERVIKKFERLHRLPPLNDPSDYTIRENLKPSLIIEGERGLVEDRKTGNKTAVIFLNDFFISAANSPTDHDVYGVLCQLPDGKEKAFSSGTHRFICSDGNYISGE